MGKKNKNQAADGPPKAFVSDSKTPDMDAKKPTWLIPLFLFVVLGGVGLFFALSGQSEDASTHTFEVVKTYPHSTNKAYTQGLEFVNGFLFESTGMTGESDWRIVNLETGEVLYRYGVSSKLFGEGITVMGDRLYQVTWRDGKAFVYDLKPLGLANLDPKKLKKSDFENKRAIRIKEFTYKGLEGWGLTNDGTHLIMSTGMPDGKIHFIDPETFEIKRHIVVKDEDGKAVSKLNELEYYKGDLYANVFLDERILKIDAKSGKILADIDFTGLLPKEGRDHDHVLNGIAITENGRIHVTGKNWPKLFEIKIKKR